MGIFKPAWLSKNWKRATKAVEKITNQELLSRIVRESDIYTVQAIALNKITDQNILIALEKSSFYDRNYSIRMQLVGKITDVLALKEIAGVGKRVANTLVEEHALAILRKICKHDFLKISSCASKCSICGYEDGEHTWDKCVQGFCTKCGKRGKSYNLYANKSKHKGRWISTASCETTCETCGAVFFEHDYTFIGSITGHSTYKCLKCGASVSDQGDFTRWEKGLKVDRSKVDMD